MIRGIDKRNLLLSAYFCSERQNDPPVQRQCLSSS